MKWASDEVGLGRSGSDDFFRMNWGPVLSLDFWLSFLRRKDVWPWTSFLRRKGDCPWTSLRRSLAMDFFFFRPPHPGDLWSSCLRRQEDQRSPGWGGRKKKKSMARLLRREVQGQSPFLLRKEVQGQTSFLRRKESQKSRDRTGPQFIRKKSSDPLRPRPTSSEAHFIRGPLHPRPNSSDTKFIRDPLHPRTTSSDTHFIRMRFRKDYCGSDLGWIVVMI